jgi:hypothetical protein
MNWASFVQGSLGELHSGSDVPDYFDCLIPVLSETVVESQIPGRLSKRSDSSLVTTEKVQVNAKSSEKCSEHEDASHSKPKVRTPGNEEEKSLISEPLNNLSFASPVKNPMTPKRARKKEGIQIDDSDDEINPDSIDIQSPIPEEKQRKSISETSLASQFEALANSVIDRYWHEVETDIPRLRRDCKFFVSMKPARYQTIRRFMNENLQKKIESLAGPHINFVRID